MTYYFRQSHIDTKYVLSKLSSFMSIFLLTSTPTTPDYPETCLIRFQLAIGHEHLWFSTLDIVF